MPDLMRGALLAASRSRWLRERAVRYRFVRRAVTRFMPGETLDDALEAAGRLGSAGMASVLTCLGENISTQEEARQVAAHYLQAMDRIAALGLDAEISVKLTHLGLDLHEEIAAEGLSAIAARAGRIGSRVWIDMEDSSYTDATLELYRSILADKASAGVCLQAYLHRTPADLASLLPHGPAIRLVKGAYREPPDIALTRRQEIDARFFELACRLLEDDARRSGAWAVFGTHDAALIDRIIASAGRQGIAPGAYEFDLLYGIRRDQQERLIREGHRVRVLISYGSHWFPWYMRRLAERPANLWFVARNLVR